METNFKWEQTKQLNVVQILLAFAIPSSLAFFGFRFVLPWLVGNGYPKLVMWGIIAAVMLFVFSIAGFFLIRKDAVRLNISLKERLLLKKVTGKYWLICLGILIFGALLAQAISPFIGNFIELTGLSIPDYMPFWLDPSINPIEADINELSPNYQIKNSITLAFVMAVALLLNIIAEEVYFRAWLLPKMQSLGKWSWVANGVLFALYHTFQLWLFPIIAIMSLAFTLTVYLTKSIVPAFVMHLIANFLFSILGILYLIFN